MLTITCKKILSKRFRPLCQRELDDFITLMVGLYQECRRGRSAVHCAAQYRDIMMIIKLMGCVVAGTMPVDTFRVDAFPCMVFRLRFSGLQKSILGLYAKKSAMNSDFFCFGLVVTGFAVPWRGRGYGLSVCFVSCLRRPEVRAQRIRVRPVPGRGYKAPYHRCLSGASGR